MRPFPALINRFMIWLQKSDLKGKYSFYLRTRYIFNQYHITHQSKKGKFAVPYDQWCFWKTQGPANYYLDEMAPYCRAINEHLDHFDFIDLGADVGVVSHLVANNCPKINAIYAFEPNPRSFEILKLNSQFSLIPFTPFNIAVSNFEGTVHFEYATTVQSDHEGHIDPDRKGNTQVSFLDKLLSDAESLQLALKIDVEGQEAQIFSGARRLLEQCKKAVILLEIHPDTLERDKMTPEDIFQTAENIRNIVWQVPLTGSKVDRSTPFFEQFDKQQYDVIGITL
jgi:FkbM family methyltransferase